MLLFSDHTTAVAASDVQFDQNANSPDNVNSSNNNENVNNSNNKDPGRIIPNYRAGTWSNYRAGTW